MGSGKNVIFNLNFDVFHSNLANSFCVYLVLEAEEDMCNKTASAPKALGV